MLRASSVQSAVFTLSAWDVVKYFLISVFFLIIFYYVVDVSLFKSLPCWDTLTFSSFPVLYEIAVSKGSRNSCHNERGSFSVSTKRFRV